MRRVSAACLRRVVSGWLSGCVSGWLWGGLWLGLLGADVWSDAARGARDGLSLFSTVRRAELKDAPELRRFRDEAPLVDPSRRLQIEELKSWPTILDARR